MLDLEITEKISIIKYDCLVLCRLLGILMDNAIEASMEGPTKHLHLAILQTSNCTTFIIANSIKLPEIDLSRIYEAGYTTKADHNGLGLSYVDKTITSDSRLSLITECENGIFRQIFTIQQ